MQNITRFGLAVFFLCFVMAPAFCGTPKSGKTRVLITTDGEVDDECSMVRFLLYSNEWDIEGIVTSSSQYHWQGHNWAGDDWLDSYLQSYAEVYPNLVLHDPAYPTPEFLKKRTFLGNVKSEGDMAAATPGSEHIVRVLLNQNDTRPIWIQAWGGTNTIARALKSIEEKYPERMEEVARKLRFFFIWEQDETYQSYILPRWGKYQIPTIISDQFWALAYQWKQIQPRHLHSYFSAEWMNANILNKHGPLAALYKAHVSGSHGLSWDTNFKPGEFRSEGDSPAFLHTIPTGLRSLESPEWGGWGGRYQKVRDNTWLDPVPSDIYKYPKGRWYTQTGWGRVSLRQGETTFNNPRVRSYFKPLWRWTEAMQNDFAARADWSVKSVKEANHPPQVQIKGELDRRVKPGELVHLDASPSKDPDGDDLTFSWWQYQEADTYTGAVKIKNANATKAAYKVPGDAKSGESIHLVLEVKDSGTPPLTRYRRVVSIVE